MTRKLVILSSALVALVAVTFDAAQADAARCCRNRGRRCCGGGYGGGCGYSGGCGTGGCGVNRSGYAGCGWRGGCNRYGGCNYAYTGGGYAAQPCAYQGSPVMTNGTYTSPAPMPNTAPAPPPEASSAPLTPATPDGVAAPAPATGT